MLFNLLIVARHETMAACLQERRVAVAQRRIDPLGRVLRRSGCNWIEGYVGDRDDER